MTVVIVHEDPKKQPDGARVLFYTKAPYVPLTVRVFINGQLVDRDNDEYSFSELGNGCIQLNKAPRLLDHLRIQYRPL